eukprot:2184082-Pleurochrysis_carterae.AAC.2
MQQCGGKDLHAQAAQSACVSMRTGARVSDANLGMCIKSGSMFVIADMPKHGMPLQWTWVGASGAYVQMR